MGSDQKSDDLLRKARRLQRDSASDGKRASYSPSTDNRSWLQKLVGAVKAVGRVLGPIGSFFGWVAKRIALWIRWVAYEIDDFDSTPDNTDYDFAPKRLLWTVPVSLAVLIAIHVALSALYFYTTRFEEMVYVTGKQEIETGEKYQFGGCTSLPCSTESDNGKFYLIETSLYFPMLFYPEEDVFANIPQQNGACKVHGYGIYFRTLRWLYKSLQLYQHVTDVSCRPYTDEEIDKAMIDGDINVD